MEQTTIKKRSVENADGFNNWTKIMLIISMVILVLENYQRYGLFNGPFEIVGLVVDTIISHLWLCPIIFGCVFQQTLQLYCIEKLLIMKILSDKVGLFLHAVNAFFSVSICVVTSRTYLLNPAVVRAVMLVVFYKVPKVWSYAYVNYKLRILSVKNKKVSDNVPVTYPKNVTIRNAITFMIFTPDIQYQPSGYRRTLPNWKGCLTKTMCMFWTYCVLTFISVQFVIPELQAIKQMEFKFIPLTQSVLKLMIYCHILWLNVYLITYRLYHPAYADLMGMSHLKFDSDWWNSTDFMEFWRRWNKIIYIGMKDTVVKPLLLKGWSKYRVEFTSFFIAGCLHELLYGLPIRLSPGGATLLTLIEIPIGRYSQRISKKYGKEYGNILMWLYLMVTHAMSILFIFCIHIIVGVS